jgi:hypothetical protein
MLFDNPHPRTGELPHGCESPHDPAPRLPEPPRRQQCAHATSPWQGIARHRRRTRDPLSRAGFGVGLVSFGVPIAYMTTNVNMATLQAADLQHMKNAIHPRLQRRDEKLNEQLIPLYDPTGRLFLANEVPTPQDPETVWQQAQVDARHGIRRINEFRALIGLDPVPRGNEAWLPLNRAPVSQPHTAAKLQGESENPAGFSEDN